MKNVFYEARSYSLIFSKADNYVNWLLNLILATKTKTGQNPACTEVQIL